MMHRTAQPCTEPWSESNLEQVDATSLSAWQSPWANGSSASIAFTATDLMFRPRDANEVLKAIHKLKRRAYLCAASAPAVASGARA